MCIVRDDQGGFGAGTATGGTFGGVGGAMNDAAAAGVAGFGNKGGFDASTGAVSAISGQAAKQYKATGSTAERPVTGADYFKQFPDVASEYAKVNGPGLAQALGLSNDKNASMTADQFAEWHISQPGNGDFRRAYGMASQEAASTGDPTKDLITNLTSGFTNTLNTLQDQNKTLVQSITDGQTNMTNLINGMQQSYATSQQDLITQMTDASAKSTAAMAKAITDAQAQSGQKEKKPNYGKALDKNKQLNGSGLGSTALTGSGGVPVGSLTLGSTSILGA